MNILEALGNSGADYLANAQVTVKTNLGPPFTFSPGAVSESDTDTGPGFLQYGVTVRDRNGHTIARYGADPATDPLKVAIVLAAFAALAFVVIRGIIPR